MPDPARICGYDVLGRVAVGGMGTVYAAVRRGPGGFAKRVAIKQLHANLQLAEEARSRFAGEARLAARLQHPNIVPIHDLEVHETPSGASQQFLFSRWRRTGA